MPYLAWPEGGWGGVLSTLCASHRGVPVVSVRFCIGFVEILTGYRAKARGEM